MGLSAGGKGTRQGKPDASRPTPAGLGSREVAIAILDEVLHRRRPLEGALDRAARSADVAAHASDLALARLIAATSLRRLGQIKDVLGHFLTKPLPEEAGRVRLILITGVAQLLFLESAPHAAIDSAVSLCHRAGSAARLAGLVNAVLRKVSTEGPAIIAAQNAGRLNTPDWLWRRWCTAYGEMTAQAVATAHLQEAALDLTVPTDADGWAARLGGVVMPTGSVRIKAKGRIEALEGYAEGAWWVQDAAAALPARLLGDVAGLRVADLCAAPGGKTAQLASMGARVTAVDLSGARLKTLRENLGRLKLSADIVEADAGTWQPAEHFDAVLVDAPCLSTGTIRRHPDLPHLKRADDLKALAGIQAKILDNGLRMLRPGGTLVYCTCSLEPEEGAQQIAQLLARRSDLAFVPITPGEHGIAAAWLTAEGYLRTLPCHLPMQQPELSGLDGFFAARLRRIG